VYVSVYGHIWACMSGYDSVTWVQGSVSNEHVGR
jgi:hypothetical protein